MDDLKKGIQNIKAQLQALKREVLVAGDHAGALTQVSDAPLVTVTEGKCAPEGRKLATVFRVVAG